MSTPNEARKKLKELLKKSEKEALTKDELEKMDKLRVKALSDVPNIQHWVLSSAGPPNNGWTEAKWKKFHTELPKMLTPITVPIYRGTKFPWIMGGNIKLKSLTDIKDRIKRFEEDFEKGKTTKVTRIMPFTKSKAIAERFATEAKGYKMEQGYTFDNGYIHVIKATEGLKGVDVAKEVAKQYKSVSSNSNEKTVSKQEKEVLIVPGTTLRPAKRDGRIFTWEIDSKSPNKTRKRVKPVKKTRKVQRTAQV